MSTQPPNAPISEALTPIGARLKAAREALGFECKEVAIMLRLQEKVIKMIEKDRYPANLPVTFIRGYIRAYAKLLQIPEHEISKGLEPIKFKVPSISTTMKATPAVQHDRYFISIFSYLLPFALFALAGIWWYNHTTALNTMENSLTGIVENIHNPSVLPSNDQKLASKLSSEPPSELPQNTDKGFTS